MLRRWWSNKYHLPPNHPLFLERSEAAHYIDLLEDVLVKRTDLSEAIERGEGPPNASELIASLDGIVGESSGATDPLIDEWEADLAAGRVPDLTKGMPGGDTLAG